MKEKHCLKCVSPTSDFNEPLHVSAMVLFPNRVSPSIPAGLYRAGLAGYVGFQKNRNIKGELAQASVFVFLKGTTAPTGFLGWRDEREEGVGRSPSPHSPFFLFSIAHSLPVSLYHSVHL